MATILVWSDDAHVRGELCAKAATLGNVHEAQGDGPSDAVALALKDAAAKAGADLVLVGATKKGKDVAPRVAAHLDWPFAAEAQELETGWKVARMVLSGNSKATYSMGPKAVVSVMGKTFEGQGKGTPVALQLPQSRIQVTGRKEQKHSDFDLGSAPVVVGVGRGFKAQGDIKLAEELAKAFPGGAVGCSRPIAADLKWLGEEHWIGLSGHAIKPKAYIACGVSGQIQHIAGIRGSKLIVAINTNKDAPIFGVCDYGIVGDLYQVVPALTQALRK